MTAHQKRRRGGTFVTLDPNETVIVMYALKHFQALQKANPPSDPDERKEMEDITNELHDRIAKRVKSSRLFR